MKFIDDAIVAGKTNFILIGEAGCGKSEIALNLAKYFAENTDKKVHLFDMDMTKPLFRSRDLLDNTELSEINFHFAEQFYDAPTVVGGVREHLSNDEEIVVMDVGGDDIGARSIGGFMMGADKNKLCVMYVLNYYRPFCQDIEHIDQFLAEILQVSRLTIDDIHFIHNPNAGITTSAEETIEGARQMNELISSYRNIEMTCIREDIADEVLQELLHEDFPFEKNLGISDSTDYMKVHLYLTYEWLKT